jgi:hypothetical protein
MQTPPDDNLAPKSVPGKPQIIFANWRERLNELSLTVAGRQAHTAAIEAFLDYCRLTGLSVEVKTARDFMSDTLRRGLSHDPENWKEALNWFFTEGRKHSATNPQGTPTAGHADTGTTPWESRLIERLRLKHYSWRTETTYREWAWRLDRFDVATTQIYTHVMARPGLGIRSPLNRLPAPSA